MGQSYGVNTTADPAPGGVPVWTDGVQYARFRNVTVVAGQPLALTVRNGVSGYAILSGIQILGSAPTPPPVITSQPTNQIVAVGNSATFSVTASGNALAYQWSFNLTNLAGATNATLILNNVQFAQAGSYAVQVSDVGGATLSSNAVLTVVSGPPTNSFSLLDVDLVRDDGGGGISPKTGYAAIGQATNDFWNFYDRSTAPGVWRTSGAVVNLKTADGVVTPVGMSVSDAPGAYGNGSSDPMYGIYDYPLDNGNNVVTFTNLPAGEYDVLAYSQDGNYEVTVGGTSYGVKTTADPAPGGVPVWTEGVQYARFQNVTVVAGQPLALTVRNGVSGYAILSGIQILSSGPPPPPTNSLSLLDVDLGEDQGGGVSSKTGYAAIGQATNDFLELLRPVHCTRGVADIGSAGELKDGGRRGDGGGDERVGCAGGVWQRFERSDVWNLRLSVGQW